MPQKRIGKSKNGDGHGEPLIAAEDENLWQNITKDVKPLKPKKTAKNTVLVKKSVHSAPKKPVKAVLLPPEVRLKPPQNIGDKQNLSATQMAARQRKRHHSGKMDIEGKIDLHGKTLDSAFRVLKSFLLRAYNTEKRNILVITGKGRARDDGQTIRQSLPKWIHADKDMGAVVLSLSPAQPKDGGDGAWYILLRRPKSNR